MSMQMVLTVEEAQFQHSCIWIWLHACCYIVYFYIELEFNPCSFLLFLMIFNFTLEISWMWRTQNIDNKMLLFKKKNIA